MHGLLAVRHTAVCVSKFCVHHALCMHFGTGSAWSPCIVFGQLAAVHAPTPTPAPCLLARASTGLAYQGHTPSRDIHRLGPPFPCIAQLLQPVKPFSIRPPLHPFVLSWLQRHLHQALTCICILLVLVLVLVTGTGRILTTLSAPSACNFPQHLGAG